MCNFKKIILGDNLGITATILTLFLIPFALIYGYEDICDYYETWDNLNIWLLIFGSSIILLIPFWFIVRAVSQAVESGAIKERSFINMIIYFILVLIVAVSMGAFMISLFLLTIPVVVLWTVAFVIIVTLKTVLSILL